MSWPRYVREEFQCSGEDRIWSRRVSCDMPHKTKAARRAYQAKWAREINPVARKDAWRRYDHAHRAERAQRRLALYARRRARTWARSDGRCYLCGIVLEESTFVVDHRVPTSRGGVDDERNRRASCRSCNAQKRDKTAREYRDWLRVRGVLPPKTDGDGLPDWSLDEHDTERALGLK